MEAEYDENQPDSKPQAQEQQQDGGDDDQSIVVEESSSRTKHPLSAFLDVLLEENASLVDAYIVLDRAAILPEKQSQTCQLLEAHASFANSMPELSRWASHIVRTSPAALEREREREQKAAYQLHASPTRPQRRTSFEVPRSGERLVQQQDERQRRALSQSLTQLSMIQQDEDLEKVSKSTLPPRVPVRRASSRVMSPPPPSVETRGRQQQQNEESEEFSSSNSFQLEFSESDRHEEDSLILSVARDIQSLSVQSAEDDTPRRPASYEDRALRGTRVRSMSPRNFPEVADDKRIAHNAARHRRTSLSMELSRKPSSMEALPQLEGFSNPPHQRVLPTRGGSSLQLGATDNNNTAPHGGNAELSLTKVASSKVLLMPKRRPMDAMEEKVNPVPNSPTTVQKAVKKTLLGRMKNKVKDTIQGKPRGRSKSPVRLPVRQESVSSHG